MKIRIGQRGQQLYDYTSYVYESNEVTLTQERERIAFERVVSDVHIVLNNASDIFSTLFGTANSKTRFEVEISEENRVLFVGEIKQPIDFDSITETVAFDAFSLDKMFWEVTRNHTMKEVVLINAFDDRAMNGLYITLSIFLQIMFTRIRAFDIIAGVDIDSLYASRPIRAYQDGTTNNPVLDNNGRLKEINPNMTVYDLLDAMTKYYNAQFFINPITRRLVMSKRGAILNDVQTDLSGKIIEEGTIIATTQDAEKYDYILTLLKLPAFSAPIFQGTNNTFTDTSYLNGIYNYAATYTYEFEGLTLESNLGAAYQIDLRKRNVSDTDYYWRLTLGYPIGPSGTTRRRLYRQELDENNNPLTPFYLIDEVSGNSAASYVDFKAKLSSYVLAKADIVEFDGSIWFSYDESVGSWLTPIKNDGTNLPPIGRILDVTPKIQFLNINSRSQLKDFSILDVISFFGGESDFDLSVFQEQWRDVFVTKKKLVSKFKDLNYMIGDTVIFPSSIPAVRTIGRNKFKIERTTSELISEATELELVTL